MQVVTDWQTQAMTMGTELSKFTYGLYADGMRASVTETVKVGATPSKDTRTGTYGYDNHHLTDETPVRRPAAMISATYDVVGNRLRHVIQAGGARN